MRAARIDCCRVLELGCASGVNLIAMAGDLPESEFTGIDGSAVHAARGAALVRAIGLQNVRISHEDIRGFEPGLLRYDFIIAHGVYSWVDDDVREALLRVIRDSLAANGIAFVSYNTYPGWFMLRAVREMMLFHARHAQSPLERVEKGSEIVTFLLDHLDPRTNVYAANLAIYQNALEERFGLSQSERLASILYDELSPVNEPVFFHEFMRRAGEAELQYLAEADLRGSTPAGLPPAVVRQIRDLAADLTSVEQYMDFLINRTFRQTLLCRKEVVLTRSLRSGRDVLQDLYFWTTASPAVDYDVVRPGLTLRLSADGSELATDHLLSKAALLVLASASPRSMSWDELVRDAAAMTAEAEPSRQDQDVLSATLLRGFLTQRALVGLSTVPDRFTSAISAAPRCAPLVRLLASEGQRRVPNKRHERVVLGPLAMEVAQRLDGAHGAEGLRPVYERRARELKEQGIPVPDVETTFESLLSWFARAALLEA
jgi:methyltransferase-like protein